MAASTYFDQVQQLYIAYFGRPADTVGQAYWADRIDAANGSIASVIAGFSASAESVALFGTATSAQKVTAIYQNAFGRAPEAAGLAYWVAQLDSGKVSQAQASWTIQQAAGPGDASAVNNKLIAAKAFTAQIDTNAEIAGYNGAAAAALARTYLSKADATYASIANVAVDSIAAVGTATGTAVVTPVTPVTPSAFTATVANHVATFGGTATGDISVAWAAGVGVSDATFSRGGNVAVPVAGVTSVALASTDVLAGSAATLVGLTVTGTGGVKLTDTAVALTTKTFAATTSSDVLTVTGATAGADLSLLTGFENIHLSGSSTIITIANGAGTVVDTSAAVIVTLGDLGQVFNGSAGDDTVVGGSGNDTISAGAGVNTLTGNAGNDTYNIANGSTNVINGLSTGDILVVGTAATVTASNITDFVATSATSNAGTVTLNAGVAVSTINLTAATGANGFTVVGGAGADIITGSSKADVISGGIGADVLTGGAGADTLTGNAGADHFVIGNTDSGLTVLTADHITDFVVSSDKLVLGVAATNGNTTIVAAAAADFGAALIAANASFALDTNGNQEYYVANNGVDTYVFVDNGATHSVADQVIVLTGVVGMAVADIAAA